jgi:DNA-binding NarL/FixJ family response regulator
MSDTDLITLAVVDDNRLVREGLVALLNEVSEFSAIAYANTESAIVAEPRPRVLLLDVSLDGDETLHVARALVNRVPGIGIIVMDLIPVAEEILELVNAGVSGFVMKDASFEDFAATVRAVAGGGKVLPARMTESLFAQIANEAGRQREHQRLQDVRMTPRELEVIALIGEGLSNKEIAQQLDIAGHTVKSHVRNVMEKLALHTRLQIAAYSRR